MEYYDFTLFALVAATVFPKVFFAGASPFLATFQSVATFSVAYVLRPFAGAFLGSLGDRIGRRRVLFFSMMIMGFATIAIGFIPSVATIGWVAPALLLLMRVLQGIGASAEFSGATLVAVEFAPKHRRGLLGSMPGVGSGLGGLLGTLVLLAVQSLMTKAQFVGWGWRIPFLLGGILVGYGLWLRARLPETPEFTSLEKAGVTSRTPLWETVRQHPRALLGSMLVMLARSGLAYFVLVFLVSYTTGRVGLAVGVTFVALTISKVIQLFLTAFFGWLSDKVGRVVIIAGGLVLMVAMAFPLFMLIQPDWPLGFVLALLFGNSIVIAALVGPVGRLMTEHLPVRHRYTGMGLAVETGTAIGGAVVPPLAVYLSYLKGVGTTPLSLLIIAVSLLGLLGLLALPQKKASLAEERATETSNPPVEQRETPAVVSD